MINVPITPLTHIGSLILEDHPYILPFEILKHASDGKLVARLPHNQIYYNTHFAELLQVVSTFGSYCVALHLNEPGRMAFLAAEARMRKINFSYLAEQDLVVTAMPLLHTPRSAKALITITAETEIVYSYEIDYILFTQPSFRKVFGSLFKQTDESAPHQSTLPSSIIRPVDPTHFTVLIDPFRADHCKGHFENHPIVPAVFVVDILTRRIREWMAINKLDTNKVVISGVELFANKAMPVDTGFIAPVTAIKMSAKTTQFLCRVHNAEGQEFGVYSIAIETK